MATGASPSSKYAASLSRNSRMPTFTGSMDASFVYAPVRIIGATHLAGVLIQGEATAFLEPHFAAQRNCAAACFSNASCREADLVGPSIGPLHLNHKMAAAKLKHKLSAAAILCFKSQRPQR